MHRARSVFGVLLALAACSEPGDTAMRRGNQAAAKGDLAAAEAEFFQATKDAPRSARAFELWGNALWAQGKRPEAEKAWEQAAKLEADSPDAHLGLARAALARNQFPAALTHLDAVKTARADEKALRAMVLLARGEEADLRKAQDAARKALELDPDSVDALYVAGCAALALRDETGARKLFDKLLQSHKESELGPLGMARLAAARGQRTDVLLYLRATRQVMGQRWKAAEILADPAFAFLSRDAELAREVGEP